MHLIAPEGYPFVFLPAIAGLLALVAGYPLPAALLLLIAVSCICFFRNPRRNSIAPANAILAPADGKIILITDSPAEPASLGLTRQVSIFMSPADVHVNRAPIAGTVKTSRYSRGKKLPAFRDKASELNEHSFVVIQGAAGTIAYRQIAGAVARRVVCDLAVGDNVERGQRVGIIKFSSRVDLYLPSTVTIASAVGERARAGETVIGSFPAGEAM
jgi:phosphatidylserine decarboxylase